jgi:hypothetical protein
MDCIDTLQEFSNDLHTFYFFLNRESNVLLHLVHIQASYALLFLDTLGGSVYIHHYYRDGYSHLLDLLNFLQCCDRIDTVLNVLNDCDEEVQIYKVKRNELTELTAAENLLSEIEQNFSVNIENAILQTIQNKYEALEKYTKN